MDELARLRRENELLKKTNVKLQSSQASPTAGVQKSVIKHVLKPENGSTAKLANVDKSPQKGSTAKLTNVDKSPQKGLTAAQIMQRIRHKDGASLEKSPKLHRPSSEKPRTSHSSSSEMSPKSHRLASDKSPRSRMSSAGSIEMSPKSHRPSSDKSPKSHRSSAGIPKSHEIKKDNSEKIPAETQKSAKAFTELQKSQKIPTDLHKSARASTENNRFVKIHSPTRVHKLHKMARPPTSSQKRPIAQAETGLPSPKKIKIERPADKPFPPQRAPIPVALTILATGAKDVKGNALPQCFWVLDGRLQVWEILKRWALEVLRLPAQKLPGGSTGGPNHYKARGILAMGNTGPLNMEECLLRVVGLLSIKNAHRQIAVTWPTTALPSKWGVKPVLDPYKKKNKSNTCQDCGSLIEFRKTSSENFSRCFAVCTGCSQIKGSSQRRSDGG